MLYRFNSHTLLTGRLFDEIYTIGVDKGFDGLYNHFLKEVLQKYKDAVHPITRKPLIYIVGEPGAKDAYIYF